MLLLPWIQWVGLRLQPVPGGVLQTQLRLSGLLFLSGRQVPARCGDHVLPKLQCGYVFHRTGQHQQRGVPVLSGWDLHYDAGRVSLYILSAGVVHKCTGNDQLLSVQQRVVLCCVRIDIVSDLFVVQHVRGLFTDMSARLDQRHRNLLGLRGGLHWRWIFVSIMHIRPFQKHMRVCKLFLLSGGVLFQCFSVCIVSTGHIQHSHGRHVVGLLLCLRLGDVFQRCVKYKQRVLHSLFSGILFSST